MNKKQYCAVLVSMNLILTPAYVYALPTGQNVVHGDVTFTTSQNTMNIKASDKAIINYNSFDIQKNELVKFIQPSANAVVLNRVIMANPSHILGELSANGRVFLINPAGIIFGSQAQINTASFLASTLNISDEDFLKGNYKFTQLKNMPKSFIIQNGTIKISDNGFVVLAAPFIKNGGVILAKTGTVHIGAVDNFYLNFDGQNLIMFDYKPDESKVKDNHVVLTPEARDEIIKDVLNTESSSNLKIVKEDGVIKLVNGSGTAIVDGKISTDATQNNKAGNINIQAQNYIAVTHSATLSSNGIDKTNGGKISIFSQNNAYLDGATLLAKAGDNGGNGGFIEFSAKKHVTINGATIDTSAKNGINGVFLIDPEDLIISDDLTDQNTNIIEEATNSITLNEGKTLSTQNGYDISLYAPNITLENNSVLTSGNNILLQTTQGINGDTPTSSSITIKDGATLTASNDLTINATSTATKVFDSDSDNEALKTLTDVGNFLVDMPKTPIAYGDSEATSTITIGASSLKANSINISSTSSASSSISANFYVIALAYGKVSSKSNISLNGTSIEAIKDININSNANSLNSVKTSATNMVNTTVQTPGENIAVAVSETQTEAKNIIDANTNIKAGGNVNITSEGVKDITTSAKGKSSTNGDLGTAVAVSNSNSDVETKVGGSITGSSVNVASKTTITNLETTSSVKVGGVSSVFKSLLNVVNKTNSSDVKNSLDKSVQSQKASTDINKKSSVKKIALAASVSISNHENKNTAIIDDGATINSIDDVNVNSNIDYLQASNNGISTTAKATIKSSEDNEKQNSLSGAVDITNITNNSIAKIGNGATVDSSYGAINVKAQTTLSYDIDWNDLYTLDSDQLKDQNMINVLANIGSELGASTEDLLSRVTSYAISNAKGSENSMAGSFDDFRMTNNTSATIDENAQINQNHNDEDSNNYQNVNVFALNDIDNINFAGGISNAEEDAAIGGSYLNAIYTNNITASINKNANVYASALKVQAVQKTHTVDVSTAGGKSDYSIAGSFSSITTNDNVKSFIDGANITTTDGLNEKYDPNSDNTNLKIDAQNELDVFNGSGGVAKGSSVGVGASVTLNNINRDTEAYIINSEFLTGDMYTNEITAENKGSVNAYSLAAAMTSSTSSSDSAQSSAAGSFGIGISGDAAINTLNDKSIAYVDSTYFQKNEDDVVNSLTIDAENSTALLGLGGAATLTLSSGAGLAGSYVSNELSKDTESYITNSTMYLDKLNIISQNTSPVAAYSISGSVGTKSELNLAGSVVTNTLTNKNYTSIYNSNITLNRDLTLNSSDNTPISTDAGGAAVSGTAGIGGSYAQTSVNNDIKSYIDSSGVSTPNNIVITAQQNDSINKAIAATLGGSLEGVAAAVSIIKNDIASTIESYIDASTASTDLFGANISVTAQDNTNVESSAGAVAVSGEGSVGGSYITNNIKNTIKAYAQKSHITTGIALSVKAIANRTLKNIAVGGAGGAFIGGTGSVILNNIAETVESYIQNSIISTSSIAAQSIEQNNIQDYSGGMSGSSILGASGSKNTDNISNTITSYIDNSQIESNGITYTIDIPDLTKNDYTQSRKFSGINVLALANETISPYSANGSFSTDGLALTGSLNSVNISDNLNSTITNSNINQNSTPAPEQNVEVDSVFNNTLNINAGAASFSGGVGVGGSVNNVKINNITDSHIDTSAINDSGEISANTQGMTSIISKTISGAASIYASLGGSTLLIDVEDTNNAYINNSFTTSNSATVSSTDNTLLGYNLDSSENALLTGVLAGGAEGVGLSVTMNTIKNSSIARIVNSIVDTSSSISVNAQNKAYILSKSGAASAGLYAAGGTININTINSTTQAYTSNSILNSNTNTASDVSISANDLTDVNDNLGVKSLGLAGVGGSLDFTNIINHTAAKIGENTQVYANNLNIISTSEKNFNSYTTSFGGGSLSGSAVILTMGGKLEDLAKTAYGNTAKTLSNISETLFGTTPDEVDPFGTIDKSYTYASIESGSLIKANSDLNMEATTKYDHIYLTSGSANISAITSIGGSAALLYNGVDNKVFINTQNPILANNINMNANYDMGEIAVKSYNGGVGTEAALGADVSHVTNDFSNTVNINNNAQLEANNNISIFANTNENIVTKGIGAQGSFGLSAGLSSADISSNGNTQTNIGENSLLYAKNSITNSVNYNTQLNAYSLAAAGGILSGNGSVATIHNNSQTNLLIGASNTIESNNGITFNNAVTNNIQADAEGYNLGGLTVGVSSAYANFNPNIHTQIGQGSKLLTQNFVLNTYLNMNSQKNYISDNGVFTRASSSSGSLMGLNGSIANSIFTPTLSTDIQDNTIIKSAGNSQGSITIDTESFSNANSIVDGQSIGSLTRGYNTAYATNHTNVFTNINQGTQISSHSISIQNYDKSNINIRAYGGMGGILGANKTEATASMDNNNFINISGANISSDKGGLINILAYNDAYANIFAQSSSSGFINNNDVDARLNNNNREQNHLNVINSVINIQNSNIIGDTVNIKEKVDNVNLSLESDSVINAAGGVANSNVYLYPTIFTKVNIENSNIFGQNHLDINSNFNTEDAYFRTKAFSTISTSLIGVLNANIDNNPQTYSIVSLDKNTKIGSNGEKYTYAVSPTQTSSNYIKNVDIQNHSVSHVVTEVVHHVEKVWDLLLGWFTKEWDEITHKTVTESSTTHPSKDGDFYTTNQLHNSAQNNYSTTVSDNINTQLDVNDLSINFTNNSDAINVANNNENKINDSVQTNQRTPVEAEQNDVSKPKEFNIVDVSTQIENDTLAIKNVLKDVIHSELAVILHYIPKYIRVDYRIVEAPQKLLIAYDSTQALQNSINSLKTIIDDQHKILNDNISGVTKDDQESLTNALAAIRTMQKASETLTEAVKAAKTFKYEAIHQINLYEPAEKDIPAEEQSRADYIESTSINIINDANNMQTIIDSDTQLLADAQQEINTKISKEAEEASKAAAAAKEAAIEAAAAAVTPKIVINPIKIITPPTSEITQQTEPVIATTSTPIVVSQIVQKTAPIVQTIHPTVTPVTGKIISQTSNVENTPIVQPIVTIANINTPTSIIENPSIMIEKQLNTINIFTQSPTKAKKTKKATTK